MKNLRIESDTYVAFCRDLKGELQVLSLPGSLDHNAVQIGNTVGTHLFDFIAEWGMHKKKAAELKEYVERPDGITYFTKHQLKPGSLFFRRMAVQPEAYVPFPLTKTEPGKSPVKIVTSQCHPSCSSITLGGNVADERVFAQTVLDALKKWGQPMPIRFMPVPLLKSEKLAGQCKIRFSFSPDEKRVATRPIVVALLKELT
jgi:hypothetical protein